MVEDGRSFYTIQYHHWPVVVKLNRNMNHVNYSIWKHIWLNENKVQLINLTIRTHPHIHTSTHPHLHHKIRAVFWGPFLLHLNAAHRIQERRSIRGVGLGCGKPIWLVVYQPLWKIWKSNWKIMDDYFESHMVENGYMVEFDFHIIQLMIIPNIWKRKMFETTNQQKVFRSGKDL